ncbi:hypothetical protein HAX54_042044 [Datura stramonium]|uniref:Uncharacterized protein n=1 Tax=Datura stramonium TaxID=4076 RepID=A0ABS8SLK6_DATST|nr:hypothetical protein [Datura stramonium]
MLQTLLYRDSNLEEVNKFISANVMEWERVKDSFDNTVSIPMESSTPQKATDEEDILTSMDEPRSLYDHNGYCGNEEEEQNIEEEISKSQREVFEEMPRCKLGRSENSGYILIQWWENVQHDEKVKMDFEEPRVICQPTDPKILQDAKIEEMTCMHVDVMSLMEIAFLVRAVAKKLAFD